MSLITQMLNDLDKRGANQAVTQDALTAALRNRTTAQNAGLGPAIIAAAVIVVAGIAAIVWWQSSRPAPAEAASGAATPATPAATAGAVPPAPTLAVSTDTTTTQARAGNADSAPAAAASGTPAPKAPMPTAPVSTPTQVQPTAPVVPKLAQADTKPASPASPTQSAPAGVSAKPVAATVAVATDAGPTAPKAVTKTGAALPMKVTRPDQRAENLYKQAVTQLMQGRQHEAIESLNQSLASNPAHHDARILQSTAYLDLSRPDKAVAVLESGIAAYPDYLPYTMNLARLHASRKQVDAAVAAMQRAAPVAGEDADYHAMLGALLQQKARHADAAEHYLMALRADPSHANWLVGAAISLQATGRGADAAQAYQRALDTGDLAPEVSDFALQNLAKLR